MINLHEVLDIESTCGLLLIMTNTKKNITQYFNLNVLRGAKWVTSYPFTGTLSLAKSEAMALAAIHAGAVISIENQSGLIVGVSK